MVSKILFPQHDMNSQPRPIAGLWSYRAYRGWCLSSVAKGPLVSQQGLAGFEVFISRTHVEPGTGNMERHQAFSRKDCSLYKRFLGVSALWGLGLRNPKT